MTWLVKRLVKCLVNCLGPLTIAVAVGVAHFAASGAATAQAQFPNQPVKLVVPYSAGGLPDTVARIVGRKMQNLLGQPVVVENRAGASGGIAASALMSAPEDGYTLMLTEGSILYNSLLFLKLPYDPKALVPVVQLARAPMFLV